MKSQTANSDLAANFVAGRPSSSSFATSEAMRQGHGAIRFAKLRDSRYDQIAGKFINYEVEQIAVSPKVEMVRVGSLKGNKSAVAVNDSTVKRFKITVLDRKTGEPTEVLAKLEMREVQVLCYGVAFKFSCKAGSQSAIDSRTGKRVSLDYIKGELVRMLGTEGEVKFAAFVA